MMAVRPRARCCCSPAPASGRDQPSLVAVEKAVAPAWATVRADFAYRREGRRAPDRPPKLLATVREELAAIAADRVVVGGRSMGGRMCSMVAAGADGEPAPDALAGVVLISYPLHPPGKPDNAPRRAPAVDQVPCLFVHGTRDPFGSPDELEEWTGTIPGAVTHHWIEAGATTSRAPTTRLLRPSPAAGVPQVGDPPDAPRRRVATRIAMSSAVGRPTSRRTTFAASRPIPSPRATAIRFSPTSSDSPRRSHSPSV